MRFVVILILGVMLSTAVAMAESGQIIVSGEGRVATAPDMANVILGATTDAVSASDAMAATSEKMRVLLNTLHQFGIEGSAIQTSQLTLNPRYDNSYSTGGTRISGYTATNTVIVRIKDLSVLGDVLDQVLDSGANQFHGLRFGLQDAGPVTDEARRLAVGDAMARAELFAAAAGVTLGPLMSLQESGAAAPQPMMLELARTRSATPIAEGELEIRAGVNLVFAIGE